MKNLLAILASVALAAPVMAEPKIERWNTYHSLGCMLLLECTEGVEKVDGVDQLETVYPDSNFSQIRPEMRAMIDEMKRVGIGVYLADAKYFPSGHRGVYHTVGNNFFLNVKYMWDPTTILEVTRHEGWHAAQDCMAGTIDNTHIAIIHDPRLIPTDAKLRAEISYAGNPGVIPWEQEAIWAASEPYMTVNALKACKHPDGTMWDVYTPTPMTGEWLIKNGFWNGEVR